jgi:hypothetical protein
MLRKYQSKYALFGIAFFCFSFMEAREMVFAAGAQQEFMYFSGGQWEVVAKIAAEEVNKFANRNMSLCDIHAFTKSGEKVSVIPSDDGVRISLSGHNLQNVRDRSVTIEVGGKLVYSGTANGIDLKDMKQFGNPPSLYIMDFVKLEDFFSKFFSSKKIVINLKGSGSDTYQVGLSGFGDAIQKYFECTRFVSSKKN